MRLFASKTWTKCLLAIGLTTLVLSAAAFSPPKHRKRHGSGAVISAQEARKARERKAQLGHKLKGLRGHIHKVRAKVHQAKAKENQISESLQTVESRLETTRRALARTDARLEELDSQHRLTERRLEETQNRLALRRKLLGQRLRYNYERGQATYTQLLVESRSVNELMSRSHYVRRIVQSDSELIQGVRQDIRQIEEDKRRLEAQTREQQAVAARFQAEKEQYAADQERQKELLQGAREERVEAQGELDELEAESQAMAERIRALSEALRRRQEAERRAAEAGQHPKGNRRRRAETPTVWHGGFMRPSDGPVTSGFGYRFHPILHRRKLHTGVDFGAGYGSPIRAAAGGTVIMASYSRGYGNCVIIDHGGGVTTLYGHCSALLVSAGETVRQGQQIGRVGSTGLSTGPHLHFEVRHDGTPVQPF